MKIIYCSVYTIFLMTVYTYAGCLDCFCSSKAERVIKTIRIEAPQSKYPAQVPAIIQPHTQQTLPVPIPEARPRSTTTSDMQHIRSTVVGTPVFAYPGRSVSASSAGLAPETLSLPSTPLSPASDSSPSSPKPPLLLLHDESPLFEPERIITYPPKIQEQQIRDRYLHATALVEAFKRDLLIIMDKHQHIWRINADINDARTSFVTMLTEYCTTHHIDDFPCIIDYLDAHTGKAKSVTMNEGQYADLRDLGKRSLGRSLTPKEIACVFNTIGIPGELIFEEFSHALKYDASSHGYTKQCCLLLKQERITQLEKLIPKHLPLSVDQAENIMRAVSVKLDGKKYSLKQCMLNKASPEARAKLEADEDHKPQSLAESSHILDPRFKPLVISKYLQSLHY